MKMKRFYAVFVARNREFTRDTSALAWNILLPVLIVAGFAFALSGKGNNIYKVGIYHNTNDMALIESSVPSLYQEFLQTNYIQFIPVHDLDKAITKVGRHQLDMLLDGDNVRHGLNMNLGFKETDRVENIRRIGEISKLFVDTGVVSLSSFISPYAADRNEVRALHDAAGMDFIEIFVDCSLEEAEARDPKGLYKKARAGEIKNFTGIDDPYEEPRNPEVHLHSDKQTLAEEVDIILAVLRERGIITA